MPLILSDQHSEIEAAEPLHELGFEFEMLGGEFNINDGAALQNGLQRYIHVKGSSKASSWLDSRKPGEPARDYAAWARSMGHTSVFVFVHPIQINDADLKNDKIRFPRPTVNI